MTGWKTLSIVVVYETPWLKVHRDKVLTQTGAPLTYSYMELQNPSVFIIAINDKHEILLQSVYRYPVRRRMWEIPAGYMNLGENRLDAAKRELMEEAGLTSTEWEYLSDIFQIVGTGNVSLQVFIAKNVVKASDATDEEEDITDHEFMSVDKIEDMIRSGELIDSPAIAALYMAKIH